MITNIAQSEQEMLSNQAKHYATKFSLSDEQGLKIAKTIKARELSGANNLLFRRNSTSGAVEVVGRDGHGITLNDALHSN